MNASAAELPVAIIGAGPVGLAAAAQLIERGLPALVLEAGPRVGSAVAAWGHIRLFSAWQHNIDPAARRLLLAGGWQPPRATALPFGRELVEHYLAPLAALPALREAVRTDATVTRVGRSGQTVPDCGAADTRPFVVHTSAADGTRTEHLARAVIDTSGTWGTPNALGRDGTPVPGEAQARAAGLITEPLPDVAGRDRARFAGRHVAVVGSGHSALNTLLSLGQLAKNVPGTRISWVVRTADAARSYGGGSRDELPARGQLGTRLRVLVEEGLIELLPAFQVTACSLAPEGPEAAAHGALTIHGDTPQGAATQTVDVLIPATGFHPELGMLGELRLDLDPTVQAPRRLGPLIDPALHSCGTVPAHGAAELSHPEQDFYLAGMKSYGRAPTFLLATGYEQVRSIVAALAGDQAAAAAVLLDLPATGVCSTPGG